MVTFDPSHRDEEYGEKDLLPPHDNHDWKREATLENGIQSLGKQAEHIKPGQRKRRQQILPRQRHGPPHDVQTQSTQPFSSLEVDLTPTISPIRCYRQCTSSTPASPSDDHAGFSFPVQAFCRAVHRLRRAAASRPKSVHSEEDGRCDVFFFRTAVILFALRQHMAQSRSDRVIGEHLTGLSTALRPHRSINRECTYYILDLGVGVSPLTMAGPPTTLCVPESPESARQDNGSLYPHPRGRCSPNVLT
ncbi:hypothetical protein CPB85DRAFT_657011 [Mucidula mucida]|nr:hypothetical protein CPB85DRAFT_657011 [Mucidula mucida]